MSAGCGRLGVLIGSVLLPAGRPPVMPWREGFGVVMVSEALIRHWETVYAEYGLASEMVNNSEPGDRATAQRMADASGTVALVWRQMATEPGIPWWSMAALTAAAQAFEFQARDWTARAKYDARTSGAPRARDRRDVYPIAQRMGRHGQGGAADAV